MKRLTSLRFPAWTAILIFFGLCISSYGLLAPKLGFYWDDWSQILVSRLFDMPHYWDYFASDRPLSAWTHILFVPLLGSKPLHWQLFTLSLRWLAAVAMWWSFRSLWPQAKSQITLAVLLFTVYPAFIQQPTAVSYHQHWTQYLLFFLSLGTMIQSLRKPARFWLLMPLSLLTLVLHLSITEFFIGVEFLRPLILWFILSETYKNRQKCSLAALKHWLPYLLIDIAFIIWRLFIVDFGEEQHPTELLSLLRSQPLQAFLQLGKFAVLDMLYILITSWAPAFDIQITNANQPLIVASWLMAALLAVGLTIYLTRLKEEDQAQADTPPPTQWQKQIILFGALVTLLGPSPVWITGNQLIMPPDVDFHSNRFALVSSFGTCLLLVAFISWLVKNKFQQILLVSILVGTAAAYQLRVTNDYRWTWTAQTRFYWQLHWRAPHIKPGTAIVAEKIFIPNQELFSTSSAINLLYPQPRYPENLSYWMYTLLPKYSGGFPEEGPIGFHTRLRILNFESASPASILIQFDPDKASCLWVLKPEDKANPALSKIMQDALYISNPDQIVNTPAAEGYPPQEIIGPEPPHGWCYLYQKAELARQDQDWQTAAQLGKEAVDQGFRPFDSPSNSPYEWLPFIEAFAHTNQWDLAQQLTTDNYEHDPRYQEMLCSLWQNIAQNTADQATEKTNTIDTINQTLDCKN